VSAEEELGPLPSGRHSFSRDQVAAHQRERLIAGLAQAVSEHGYNAVTITHITKAARVSRRVFYQHFEGKEECFLAAFDIVLAHIHELIEEAVAEVPDWPHGVVVGLRAFLEFLDDEPELARLGMVDSITAGPAIAERFRDAIDGFVPWLKMGRSERSSSQRPLPDSAEESLLGALASMISRSIAFGAPQRLTDLLPDLAEFLLMPYVGPEEAHRLAAEAA
jgi:AcrR family transcriptional regulator